MTTCYLHICSYPPYYIINQSRPWAILHLSWQSPKHLAKGPPLGQFSLGCVCFKNERTHACSSQASLTVSIYGLVNWVLISKADRNLTTKSSKNKFCTCERCHLVCLRGWSRLFMHWVGTAQGVTVLAFFKPLPQTGWSQEGPHLAGRRTARSLLPV